MVPAQSLECGTQRFFSLHPPEYRTILFTADHNAPLVWDAFDEA